VSKYSKSEEPRSTMMPTSPAAIEICLPALAESTGVGCGAREYAGDSVGGSSQEVGSILRQDSGSVHPTKCSDRERLESTQQLLDLHYDSVYRYAFRLSGCPGAAEDIAQEVFVRAFCNVHQLRSLAAGLAWLLTITRHEASRWLKARDRNQPTPLIEQQADDCHVHDLDQKEWIEQALRQLPEDFRIVVLMFYFEQKSYSDISRELGMPMGTVMSRLNRGRSHLKEALIAAGQPRSSLPPLATLRME
jgi:RNA polymerase sigma-70 factor, ECF subfamily